MVSLLLGSILEYNGGAMFIYFVSAFLGAMLLYFSLGQHLPNGWEGLVLIVVLIFLIRGINNFLSEVVKNVFKN